MTYTPLSSLKSRRNVNYNRIIALMLLIALVLIAIAWGLYGSSSTTAINIINGIAVLIIFIVGVLLILSNRRKPNVNTIWSPMQAK